jgi:3-methyl-2-oxobutanoate hydroxymethyltransferase
MANTDSNKITALTLKSRKAENRKIVAITAYDYTMARLVDESVDVILVGDSLGMVIQGESNTLSVTLDEMIYHSRAVSRGISHAHLVVDMPFMTYQARTSEAVKNAGRLLSEGKAQSVKLEGGVVISHTVEKMVQYGIPVMGHIGLTPQSVHAFGGYRVQGKTDSQRESLLTDAMALEDAGAFAIVLEAIPADLAKEITQRLKIPTIGIGAGSSCDGQVLVNQDLLGMNVDFKPRFVKSYADLGAVIRSAVDQYAKEVQEGTFPEEKHSF